MKTLGCSGLLIMLLFSKAAQHVKSFSLASLILTRHQQQSSGQQSAQRFLLVDQRSCRSSSTSSSSSSRLFGYSGDAEEEEYEIKHDMSSSPKAWSADDLLPFLPSADTHGQWSLRNDFYSFLNQCSIQSFLFLLKSLRDPYTVLWLENYTQSIIELDDHQRRLSSSFGLRTGGIAERSKLLNYHGLAAMNTTCFPTWNSYFAQLLEKPIETYIIESQLPQVPDYEMEIKPASLCTRLIAIREQIGAEFAKDLSVIAEMGGHTLESYWDSLKELKASREQETARRKQQNKEKPTGNEQQQHHDNNNHNFDVRRHNLMFLELPADTSSGHSPSPLRRGNFDLLTLLATQEAIHRVLNDQQDEHKAEQPTASSIARASKMYLTEFYMARIPSHFAGNQRYGQADAFMAELLAEMPTMKLSTSFDNDNGDKGKKDSGTAASSSSSSLNLIDPTHIAQVVMEKRREVALEWEQMARQVPDKHLEIKRLQLNMLMMGGHFGGSDSGASGSSDSPPSSSSSGGETKMVSFEEALRAKSKEDSGTCSTVAAMAAARAAAAATVPVTRTTEPPAVHKEDEKTTTTTRKTPLTTVPTRREQSDFARNIQERKKGIAARARVSAASMAVPDRSTRRRVMSDAVPEPPKIRAMAGVGFGKKENSSRGAKLVKAADDAAAVVSRRRRQRKQQNTSVSRSASVKQNIKAPPVVMTRVVKDAFVSNIKEMREKAALLPMMMAVPETFKDKPNTSPVPTRVIRLKNFGNHNKNKRSSSNNNKKSPQLAAAAAPHHLPFNRTSIFE